MKATLTIQAQANLFGEQQSTCPICRRTITTTAPCPHTVGTQQELFSLNISFAVQRRKVRKATSK